MQAALLILPELTILIGALVVFFCSIFELPVWIANRTANTWSAAAVVAAMFSLGARGEPFFSGIYQVNAFSQVLKLGISISLFFVCLLGTNERSIRAQARVDVPFFVFLTTLGMLMLVSATELLTFYVAMELSAYGLFILVSLNRREHVGSEASAKYILFGACASAISLYGISILYGTAQSTYLDVIMATTPSPFFVVGVVLTLSGLLFKLAAFPFHAWAPDTYLGAPHQIAAFVGTASKVAAVGVVLRVLTLTITDRTELSVVLMVLCVVSMTLGNLSALVQKDFKRLLGYSTIAHAGYMLMGLLCFSQLGTTAIIFYVLTYVPILVCSFIVIAGISSDGDNPQTTSVAGLYARSPFLALLLLVSMFGLAGMPPTPGLAGKWFLFSAVMERGHTWLVIVGALNATVSLYYYLQLIRHAYLPDPSGTKPAIQMPATHTIAAVVALGLILFAGFYPGPMWKMAALATDALYF